MQSDAEKVYSLTVTIKHHKLGWLEDTLLYNLVCLKHIATFTLTFTLFTSLYLDFPMPCSGVVVCYASSRAQEQTGGFNGLC